MPCTKVPTYPAQLVLFERTFNGIYWVIHINQNSELQGSVYPYTTENVRTTGFLGHTDSYTSVIPNPKIPTIKGASTCADDHGNRMPPNVSAIIHEHVEAMTSTLPLQHKGK